MAVSAVKNSNNPKRVSYIESTAAGALVGYSLKYLLPITSQEKDEHYKTALKKIKENVRINKLDEINNLKQNPSMPCSDIFLNMHENKQINVSKVKSLQESSARHILNIITRINNNAREAMNIEKRALIAKTKDIRPAHIFIIIGGALGLLIATTINIGREIAKNKAENKAANQVVQTNN